MNRFADDANADHDRLGKQSSVHGQTPQLLRRPRLQPLMAGAAMSKNGLQDGCLAVPSSFAGMNSLVDCNTPNRRA
jgi:hypothetical protein